MRTSERVAFWEKREEIQLVRAAGGQADLVALVLRWW
jgi:hypothetical protein